MAIQTRDLSADQKAKLERLAAQRAPTRYEVVIIHPNGCEALLCYTPRVGKHGMIAAIDSDQMRALALLRYLGVDDDARISSERGQGHLTVTGGGIVKFSGRTQREAIMYGELPYIVELMANPNDSDHEPVKVA